MVTSRDVARVAGVSQATVSRVLSGSSKVHPATRERVQRALSATGYSPNAMARAMRTRRTGTIGVVVARMTNPFYPELIRVLSHHLGALDLRMILWDSEGPGEISAVEAIRQSVVDGVIFTTATAESVALHAALSKKAPVVLVNRSVEGLPCDQVTSENANAAQSIADYLVEAGHRRIGVVAGPPQASTATEREKGFRMGLSRHGIDLPPELVCVGDFSHSHGHTAIRRLLGFGQPPSAVFCVNDLIAFGALDGARAANCSVPDDLWIVGHDDIQMASWEAFDLTTVRQPIGDMVRTALHMLLERIDHPDKEPEHRRFPSKMVVRGSTGHTPRRTASSEGGKGNTLDADRQV
ncbi:MAG: LacI family DNA-binding transcriptional regulator [Egibacteraceae bacterium]